MNSTSPLTPAVPVRWAGWFAAIGSTVGFSLATPVAAYLIQIGVNPTTALVFRMAVAVALLAGSLAVLSPAHLRVDRRGLLLIGGLGVFNGIGNLLFFWSLTRLSASVAVILFSLYPFAVLSLLALRGERFTYRNTIRTVLGLAGVYILIGPGGQVDVIGVLMVVAAVGITSFQLVGTQWFLGGYDPRTVTLYTVVGMLVVSAGWWVGQGVDVYMPGWTAWLGILVLAVASTWLARLGMFAAVRSLGSGQVAMLMPLETLLSVTWSLLWLGERLTPLQAAGGGLIVASALLAAQRMSRTGLVRRAGWRAR